MEEKSIDREHAAGRADTRLITQGSASTSNCIAHLLSV